MCAFVLLAATFNRRQNNHVLWVQTYGGENLSIAVLIGLVLSVGYIIVLRATLRSIGPLGMALILGIFDALVWVLFDFRVLSLDNRDLNVWLSLFGLSAVLGIGLGRSHVRRAVSGQSDVDDIDD